MVIGGACGLPWVRWRELPPSAVLVGAAAMFGYHGLYFLSLKLAEPVAANLLHYLWPLLIILLTPVLLPNHRLSCTPVVAGLLGFAGVAACVGDAPAADLGAWLLGSCRITCSLPRGIQHTRRHRVIRIRSQRLPTPASTVDMVERQYHARRLAAVIPELQAFRTLVLIRYGAAAIPLAGHCSRCTSGTL